jgi:hypothetical protein
MQPHMVAEVHEAAGDSPIDFTRLYRMEIDKPARLIVAFNLTPETSIHADVLGVTVERMPRRSQLAFWNSCVTLAVALTCAMAATLAATDQCRW